MLINRNNLLTDFNEVVYSAVLIPGVKDFNGDCLTVEEIYNNMEIFMEKYKHFDIEHSLQNVDNQVSIIESFQSPVEITVKIGEKEKTFPVGTWFLGLKILSEDLKQKILNKEVRGLSATALKKGNKVLDFLSFKSKEKLMTTFKELGDYDVIGVSLVEDPSYEDALFFSFKSKSEDVAPEPEKKENQEKTIINKMASMVLDEDGSPKHKEEVKEEMTFDELKELIVANKSAIKDLLTDEVVEETTETVEEKAEETATETKTETEDVATETVEATEEVKVEETEEKETTETVEETKVEVEAEDKIKDLETELSTKSKEYEDKIAELERKSKEQEETIIALKNKSTQPDVSKTVEKVSDGFDAFGNLIK